MTDTSESNPILIAGGGIGGMALALTLHQIGVPCIVFESVAELQPLGVGINLQPNAVRELYDLGLGAEVLDTIGIQAREWALVGRNGNDVYAEPRGLLAGYRWPQYSVHRGQLQMLLYRTVLERLGPGAVRLGHRVTGYRQHDGGVTAQVQTRDGQTLDVPGRLLVAADGLHSAVRAQMHPQQPPIQWGGAIMWRGTTPGVPIRSGASFVGLGSARHRVVLYPISQPDPASGLSTINWIAEITVDNRGGWTQGDWNRRVALEEFAHHFDGWNYGWLDVPAHAARREGDLRVPDDRPRPGAHLGGRPRGAARRRRARDVPDRLQRRQPGHRRCARAGRGAAGARRGAGRAAGL